MFCGNNGGFEKYGSSLNFTTNIPEPTVTVGTVSGNSVAIQWASDGYATWHRVEYTVQSNKRDSSTVVAAAMQTGGGMTVTGLASGRNYSFHVYAGQGTSYHEPHGAAFSVQTTAGEANQSNGGLSPGS